MPEIIERAFQAYRVEARQFCAERRNHLKTFEEVCQKIIDVLKEIEATSE